MVLEDDRWVERFNVRSFGNFQHLKLFTLPQRIHGPNTKLFTNLSDSKRDRLVVWKVSDGSVCHYRIFECAVFLTSCSQNMSSLSDTGSNCLCRQNSESLKYKKNVRLSIFLGN